MILAQKRGIFVYKPYKVKRSFQITEFYTTFEYKCDGTYSFSGESHDFWELLIVLDGKIHVSADEFVYSLSKNQVKFHKPMEFHNLRADPDFNSHYLVITFATTGNFMYQFVDKVFNLTEPQIEILSLLLEMYRSEDPDIYDPDITFFVEKLTENPGKFHRFTNILENFLIMLSENNVVMSNLVYNDETLLYKKAVNVLEDYIYSNISVEDLAKICSVSAAHLKRVFSKYAGIGVHEYFLKLKILHAKILLADGLAVTDVAEKLAFSSQNYFSVVFKRKEGLSPLQYKKKFSKK